MKAAVDLLHEARSRERAACLPEAIACFEAAISTAERTGEHAVLAEAQRRLAVVLYHRNETERARELCNQSYTVACDLKNDLLAAEALNTQGGLALATGEIEEARSFFQRALDRGGNARELQARIELNLGILANIRGNLVEAVKHYERAVEAYRATNDEHGSARAYVNLGIAHTDLRQYDWADSYFSMSFKIAERAGDLHLQGMCLVNHAEAHFARGRYEQALRNAESALAIFNQLDSRSDKSEAYKMIGMVYREIGRLPLAESRLRTAIDLAVSAGSVLNEADATRELALLIAAHGLHQEGKLARGVGFVQHRSRAHSEIDRRTQPRFGERQSADLAIHHADHLVRFGFVAARIELVEDRQRGLGVAERLLVAAARKVCLGVIHEAHTLQVEIARALGDLEAHAEVAVGPVVLPQVGMRDAEVHVRPGGAMLVVG